MIKKIGTIKNPLTIIAMFAALAEISGTAILPFINPENQSLYIWFLMIFPVILVIMFFVTLNFNPKVLYAPSDYENEDNFLRLFQEASYVERTKKAESEIETALAETKALALEGIDALEENEQKELKKVERYYKPEDKKRLIRRNYYLAEELALAKLSQEFSNRITREIRIGSFIYDGIMFSANPTIIEIKYMPVFNMKTLRRELTKVQNNLSQDLKVGLDITKLIFVIVTDKQVDWKNDQLEELTTLANESPIKTELRIYNVSDLEKEI